jgi:hypothetical protein
MAALLNPPSLAPAVVDGEVRVKAVTAAASLPQAPFAVYAAAR